MPLSESLVVGRGKRGTSICSSVVVLDLADREKGIEREREREIRCSLSDSWNLEINIGSEGICVDV